MTVIVLAAVLASCGYKGPLYLPKREPAAQTPPAATPEEKKNDAAGQ